MNRRLETVVSVCLFLFFSPFLTAETLRFKYDFSSLWEKKEWKGEWHKVAGLPVVPVVTVRKLLPAGRRLTKARFVQTLGHTEDALEFPLVPIYKPLCEGNWPMRAPYTFHEGELYPSAALGETVVQEKFGYRMLYVPIFPVQFSPQNHTGLVRIAGELEIELEAQALSDNYRGTQNDREEVRPLVDNPEILETYPLNNRAGSIQYLAIGPANLLALLGNDSLSSLLAEKNARGITTGVQSLEDIATQYQGRDLQEKTRNAIIDHYRKDLTRYVLMIGDGHSINAARKLFVDAYEPLNLPADFYYGCLDGDFDFNKNGTFGEKGDGEKGGEVDLLCEIAVGRAPASNEADLRSFVAKTLKMQRIPANDPRILNSLSIAEMLDNQTLGSWVLEKLVTGDATGIFKSQGYPSTTQFKKLYETFSTTISSTDVLTAMNQGNFYTVNHLGHANNTYDMKFSLSKISSLTNPLPFIGYTQGCYAGDITQANWAAKMVTQPNGGAGVMIANSSYGFYEPAQGEGPSNLFHRGFYHSLFKEKVKEVGKMNHRGKELLINQVLADAFMRWVYYEANLLGDPELMLKISF